MATVDSAAVLEWTAQWAADLSHLQGYDAASGGTMLVEVALANAISPAAGATVRIPAGDLDLTVAAGTGATDALAADFLGEIGSGVDLHWGWATASGSANEVSVTDYARQTVAFS